MGNIIPSDSPNEMILLGGKKTYGNSKNVHIYNLRHKTIINK